MSVGYLIVAFITAVVSTGVWILSGGGVLSGLLVYVLSGNLALASLIGVHFFRKRD